MNGKARSVAGWTAIVFLTLAGPARFAAAQDDSDLQLLLPGAKEIVKIEKKLSPEEVAKIEISTGGKFLAADKVLTVFQCLATPPDGGAVESLRAVFLPLDGQKDAMLGVAANAKGESIAVAVIQGKTLDKSRGPFLEQFQGRWALRLTASSAFPPSKLAELQKKALTGTDPESRKLDSLLRQKKWMIENNRVNGELGEMIRAKDANAAATAKDYLLLQGQAMEFVLKMNDFLETAEFKIYRDHFVEMKRAAESVQAALAKKDRDWDGANRSLRAINNRCTKCHGWDTTHFRKPLELAMSELREQMGIGQGYFVVGHDVIAPAVGAKKDDAQALAFGVKRALWILQFSFAKGE